MSLSPLALFNVLKDARQKAVAPETKPHNEVMWTTDTDLLSSFISVGSSTILASSGVPRILSAPLADTPEVGLDAFELTRINPQANFLQRKDIEDAPYGFSHDTVVIEERFPQGSGLDKFGVYVLQPFLMKVAGKEPLFFLNQNNRFFIWDAESRKLDFIVTPYNQLGLYRALDKGESLKLREVLPYRSTTPGAADPLLVSLNLIPSKWINNSKTLRGRSRHWGLEYWGFTAWQTIFYHDGGDESYAGITDFLRTTETVNDQLQRRYFLYFEFHGELVEILEPNMDELSNWHLLDQTPGFDDFILAPVTIREISGGPRKIPGELLPINWSHVDCCEDVSLYVLHKDLESSKRPMPILRRMSGDRAILLIEDVDEDDEATYYFWIEGSIENGLVLVQPEWVLGGLADLLLVINQMELNIQEGRWRWILDMILKGRC